MIILETSSRYGIPTPGYLTSACSNCIAATNANTIASTGTTITILILLMLLLL